MLEDIERRSAQVDRIIEHRAQSEKLNSQRYREEAAYRAAERLAEELRRAQLAQEWFSYHVEMGQRALAIGRACANRHAAAAAKLDAWMDAAEELNAWISGLTTWGRLVGSGKPRISRAKGR